MANDTIQAALLYREPSIEVILVQSSFLVLLNVLNWALDSLLYCGSIGQILVGIAWGVPGGNILGADAENIAVQLGYLGIILLVFEGFYAPPLEIYSISSSGELQADVYTSQVASQPLSLRYEPTSHSRLGSPPPASPHPSVSLSFSVPWSALPICNVSLPALRSARPA